MPTLNPTRRNALLLLSLLVAQLLLVSGNVQRQDGTNLLVQTIVRVTRPVVALSGMIGGGIRNVFRVAGEVREARRENRRLREELGRLRGELGHYREDALENERLRRLLAMKQLLSPNAVGARVVTRTTPDDQEHVIVLDRGAEEGVRADMAVVAWGGAVGRVVRADDHYAWVRLLSDPSGGAAGIVQRSRWGGMVLGRGDGPLEMAYVPGFADVLLGDRVVTSGLDGVFPRGFGIGRVIHVDTETGVAKRILLEPDVDFFRLEEVLVVAGPDSGAPGPGMEDAR